MDFILQSAFRLWWPLRRAVAEPELSSSAIDPEAIIEVDDGQALGLLHYLGYYK